MSSDKQTDGITMETVRGAADAIRQRADLAPELGIVLGTGLGALAGEIEPEAFITYEEIPGFPRSTVESHAGRLILGTLAGVRVVAMEGRFHRYEGYSMQQVTLPVRVMRELGAETLIVSNACGGMNPLWHEGDLVLISDHINLMGDNPLVGPNLEQGPRFPDMSEPYDSAFRTIAREEALRLGVTLREGVYVAVLGPCLETVAEYRMLRALGADAVGMSTVPEVIVARHVGLRVLGLSIISDMALPDALHPVDVAKIIATAKAAEPVLTRLVRAIVARLADGAT
jgi:purine-nucleoside phosphorylase